MICPNCRKYYDDAHLFCPFCKNKRPKTFCPKCGEVYDEEYNFCIMCGSQLKKINSKKIKLENELKDYKERNEKLKTENQELKEQNIKLENENTALTQINKEQEEKLIKTEEELNNLNESNEKLKKETHKLKEQNIKLENEIKVSLENYLNHEFLDSEYDDIRKLLLNKINNKEITKNEQIDREIEKYDLIKYFYKENNREKWKNIIITKIENRELITNEQIDSEIQRLEEEERIKLEREELISYLNEKTNIPILRKMQIKTEIENGNITSKKQINKYISSRKHRKSKKTNDEEIYRRGYRSYMEIASDICYIEDFDGWYFDRDGISFYRKGTGFYSSKFEHYSFDELKQYK